MVKHAEKKLREKACLLLEKASDQTFADMVISCLGEEYLADRLREGLAWQWQISEVVSFIEKFQIVKGRSSNNLLSL